MNSNLAYVYDEEAVVEITLSPVLAPESNVALFEQYDSDAANVEAEDLDDTCCNLYLIPA